MGHASSVVQSTIAHWGNVP